MLHYLYRISNASNVKEKLFNGDKFICLENFISIFGKEDLIIFADNCNEETLNKIKKYDVPIVEIALGNSKSWRYIVEYAIENFNHEDYVYLIEDDYIHCADSKQVLLEGLEISEYVTLYDHSDKYINYTNGGANPFVKNGGEISRVMKTSSTHWKTTNSTTMTFATKVKILVKHKDIWWRYTQTKIPKDNKAFWKISNFKDPRKNVLTFLLNYVIKSKPVLVCPLPGKSTHIERKWLSPCIKWEEL